MQEDYKEISLQEWKSNKDIRNYSVSIVSFIDFTEVTVDLWDGNKKRITQDTKERCSDPLKLADLIIKLALYEWWKQYGE